ncbi:hypothetical protein ACSTIX_24485, partial [Vibrio parahaemolyticus]
SERNLSYAKGKVSPSLNFTGTMATGYSGLAKDVIGAKFGGFQPSGITGHGDTVYTPIYNVQTKPTPWSTQFSNNVNKS